MAPLVSTYHPSSAAELDRRQPVTASESRAVVRAERLNWRAWERQCWRSDGYHMYGTGVNLNIEVCPLAKAYIMDRSQAFRARVRRG